jgi:hypothetical protein
MIDSHYSLLIHVLRYTEPISRVEESYQLDRLISPSSYEHS